MRNSAKTFRTEKGQATANTNEARELAKKEREELKAVEEAKKKAIEDSIPVNVKAVINADSDIIADTTRFDEEKNLIIGKAWTRANVAYSVLYSKHTEVLRTNYNRAWHETYLEELFQEALTMLYDEEQVAFAMERVLKDFIKKQGIDAVAKEWSLGLKHRAIVRACFRVASNSIKHYITANRLNPYTGNVKAVRENKGQEAEQVYSEIGADGKEYTVTTLPYSGEDTIYYREGAFETTATPVYTGSVSDRYFSKSDDELSLLDTLSTLQTETIEENMDYVLDMLDMDITTHLAVKDWSKARELINGQTTLRDISPRQRKRVAEVVKTSLEDLQAYNAM